MSQFMQLQPIHELHVDSQVKLKIKRQDLVPLLGDPIHLNHYADHLVQAQTRLLVDIDPKLNQQFAQVIAQLIQHLALSKKTLKTRRFNAIQKWLGRDIEYDYLQLAYLDQLELLLQQASDISLDLQKQIEQSQKRAEQFRHLREQMAQYVIAAEEFLLEYPDFVKTSHPLDNFLDRLSKRIQTLISIQSNNDIRLTQMQLSQQLSFSLLDRFKEAEQVLIPAWQHHLQQTMQSASHTELKQLDCSREILIRTLKTSLEKYQVK